MGEKQSATWWQERGEGKKPRQTEGKGKVVTHQRMKVEIRKTYYEAHNIKHGAILLAGMCV